MTTEELEHIEAQKMEAHEAIAKGEAFKRLLDNDDYKLIIQDGFLESYPKELGLAIAKNTGGYDTEKLQKTLEGINVLVGYGFTVASNMQAAEQTIAGLDQYIAEDAQVEEE